MLNLKRHRKYVKEHHFQHQSFFFCNIQQKIYWKPTRSGVSPQYVKILFRKKPVWVELPTDMF